MNKIYTLSLGAVAVITVSCADLDTQPEGEVTGDQFTESVMRDNALLEGVAKSAFFNIGKEYNVFGISQGRADDFGYPADCLSDGTNAGDIVGVNSGYNWFSVAANYGDRNVNYANPYERWAMYYNQIKCCNDLLNNIPEATTPELKAYQALGKALRAFDYFQLVQRYALTYAGHTTDPAVPMYLSDNDKTDGLTTARQTVEFVYNFIEKELDEAVTNLEGFIRPDKSVMNQSVVYGLKARVSLVKQDWAKAAEYAQKAIDLAAQEGIAPASIDEVSQVGNMFISNDEPNWMWGLSFGPTNIETDGEYETWVSQISSLASYSYTTETGCFRAINSHLWNTIADSDVRKGWWVDGDCKSPLIEGLLWSNSGETAPLGVGCGNLFDFIPYTNVKFGVYQGQFGTTQTCGDFPMMRVEEMYLILAEAQGRQDEAQGAATLEQFVKTYRDPAYSYAEKPTADFIDEVWRQRRIELWGEGFAMNDILRLKKPMVRYQGTDDPITNWAQTYQFNLPAEDGTLLMTIPQSEINGNEYISADDNNKSGTTPRMGINPELRDGVTDVR